MNLKQYLEKLVKSLHGNLIVIGLENNDINELILNSKNLNQCYFLNSNIKSKVSKKKGNYSLGKDKQVPIKKFRKTFKKKKNDTIICNIKQMKPFLRYFIKDSIYICKEKVYFYGSKRTLDIPNLKEKYARYDVTFEEIELKDSYVFIIDTSKAKTNWIIEIFYNIKDTVFFCIDLIGDYLVH